jgi:hypothetical protein
MPFCAEVVRKQIGKSNTVRVMLVRGPYALCERNEMKFLAGLVVLGCLGGQAMMAQQSPSQAMAASIIQEWPGGSFDNRTSGGLGL